MKRGAYRSFATDLVVYGEQAGTALAREAERLDAKRVFLINSRTLASETDEVSKLRFGLGGRYAGSYDGIPAHTPRESILDVAASVSEVKADLVVTFGGGSVIDAGKMVRLASQHQIRRVDEFDKFVTRVTADGARVTPTFDGPDIPQIAIPTTLSGAEFNLSAGCTDSRTKFKEIYRHDLMVPRIVILDPVVTMRTPEWLWLSTGIRTLDHAIETICSPQSDPHSYADSLAAIELLAEALPLSRHNADDLSARLDAQLASWLAMEHNRFGISMGASHGIGHVLGGMCGVPHGYTSCVMLPAVLSYNASFNHERQMLVAKALKRPDLCAAAAVRQFVSDLGLPRSLAAVGVGPEKFKAVASAAMLEHFVHMNPRPIKDPDDVMAILHAAA